MQPPTRVFVVADNHSEARRLGKIFTESAGFVVTGARVPATLSGLHARKVDDQVERRGHDGNGIAFSIRNTAGEDAHDGRGAPRKH